MRLSFRCGLAALGLLQTAVSTVSAQADKHTTKFPDLYEASVVELQDGLERGAFTSVDLVKVCAVQCIQHYSAFIALTTVMIPRRPTSLASMK